MSTFTLVLVFGVFFFFKLNENDVWNMKPHKLWAEHKWLPHDT